MKFKKMLSLLAATAVAAGSLAAMAVTADASALTDLTPIPTTVTVIQAADYTATSGAQDLTPDGYFIGGKSGILMGTKKYTYDSESINRQCFDIKSGTPDITQAKVIAFKPAAACTITAYGQYDGGKTNGRRFNIVTDKATGASAESNGTNIATVAYDGTGYVYLTSTDSSIDAYVGTITFAWSSDAPATPAPATEAPATEAPATEAPATEAPATEAPATEAPATEAPATEAPLNNLPVDTEITFDNYSGTIADGTVIDGYLRVNDSKGKAVVDANTKTVEGTTYTTRLKSGGNSAVYTLKPAADGILRVVAVTSKTEEARDFAVNGVAATTGDNPTVFDFNVKADEEVKITFPGGGVNIYGIKLVTKTQSVESSAAYTTDAGYDKDVVVGVINLNTVNTINLMAATYEGRTPQSVDNATEPVYVSGPINITVIINGATSTEALEHVMFN